MQSNKSALFKVANKRKSTTIDSQRIANMMATQWLPVPDGVRQTVVTVRLVDGTSGHGVSFVSDAGEKKREDRARVKR